MAAKILIVDDHEIVRRGIRFLLSELRPDWEICGEAGGGAAAIEGVKKLEPDVVILDIAMPFMSGIEAASRIAKMGTKSRVLLFTMYESERLVTEAQQAGAQGYVLKSQAAHHLVQAIDRLLAGGTFFGGPTPESEPSMGTPPRHGLIYYWDLGFSAA